MVIGNGMLAKAFMKYNAEKNILIFASGVANSKTLNHYDYDREIKLILDTLNALQKKSFFIYFSTCSIDNPEFANSMYVKHKLFIENLLQKHAENFIVFRLSNVVGNSSNKNTVFQYIKDKIEHQEPFEAWINAERNFIEINQLVEIINLFLNNSPTWNRKIINIANNENTKIIDLISSFEKILKKKALANYVSKGEAFTLDLSIQTSVIYENISNFAFLPLEKMIQKYL